MAVMTHTEGGEARSTASKNTYRRVVATRLGGPEVLEVIEQPVPVPVMGEVLVRVRAAGVGFPDLLMREARTPAGRSLRSPRGWMSSGMWRPSARVLRGCATATGLPR
jgi:hypothetical protein